MAELVCLEFQTGAQWRAWLAKHHASSPGVWLVFHKGHTGAKSIPYEESLSEALCYGWIDSIIKRIDDDRYVRKFTPRKPDSKWSDANRKRWTKLKAAGLLAGPGLATAPTDNRYAPRPEIPTETPAEVVDALKGNPKALNFFETLPARERCRFVYWIQIAKRPETREKRIRESIELLAAGRRLGLK